MSAAFMALVWDKENDTQSQQPCPRCGSVGIWELRILSDEPITLCFDCCLERVRKRISTELHELYRYANLEQLEGEEMDTRLVSIRQRLRVLERLTVNYQNIRRSR